MTTMIWRRVKLSFYFGDFFLSDRYVLLPLSYLRYATLDVLLGRREELSRGIFLNRYPLESIERYEALLELHYIDQEIGDRSFYGRFGEPCDLGKKVFISYSKKDSGFAHKIHDDLKKLGYAPWMDETNILAGRSIPGEIQSGIAECEYLIVFLSKNSVLSKWVEIEWVTKFWEEANKQEVQVIPAKIEECDIPPLLKTKKYANFVQNYDEGLFQVLKAIGH